MSVLELPRRLDLPGTEWIGNLRGGDFVDYRRPDVPTKLVLHTTETAGLPGYRRGYAAPQVTYYPARDTFYQHAPLDTAGMALLHPRGTVETNHAAAVQLEIVSYSAEWMVDRYGGSRIKVSALPELALARIGAFARWISERDADFEIRWDAPVRTDSRCAGADSACRLSDAEWLAATGLVGHRRVPHNDHWDPGALNIGRIVRYALGDETPTDNDGGDTMDWPVLRREAPPYTARDSVRKLQALLNVEGELDLTPGLNFDPDTLEFDGKFGPSTESSVEAFQRRRGLVVDGIVGPATWTELLEND